MGETFTLVLYDAMRQAIAEAYEVDEVKDIRDKASAMEAYFRQAKDPEPERRCCEIRLRAERKAGALLAQMDRARGRPSKQSPTSTLSDLGVSRDQSSRWQQLASVPEEDFEAALDGDTKPSTSGIINGGKPKGPPMDPKALWLWGRLRDFERECILDEDPGGLLGEMTEGMQADAMRLAVLVSDWLRKLSNGT